MFPQPQRKDDDQNAEDDEIGIDRPGRENVRGRPIVNPEFLAGSSCVAGKMGTTSKNGTVLPCRESGSGTPQQGNDGIIYD